jgi:hypothetical protein
MTTKSQPIRRKKPQKKAPPKPAPAPEQPKRIKHKRATFCPETCATILRWLSLGNFRESACARARVDDSTLRRWLERGAEELEKTPDDLELGDYAQFYVDVIEAEATAEHAMTGLVLTSGETEDVRWFLERRYPKRFGKLATRLELSGPEGKPIEVNDARRTLLGRLLAVTDAGAAQADDPVAEPS